MAAFTVIGDRLRFEERDVELDGPVYDLYESTDSILVVEEDEGGENVVALEPDGTRKWRIGIPDWPDDEKGYYLDAWYDGEEVWARSHAGYKYRIDDDTGEPLERLATETVPVGDSTVPMDLPVERFFRRGETTVALLDWLEAGDDERERGNVVAVEPDGSIRWRIGGIERPGTGIRHPFGSGDPEAVELDRRYNGLRAESDTLVAEHRKEIPATVDPDDGRVTARGLWVIRNVPLESVDVEGTLILDPETWVRLPENSVSEVREVADAVMVRFDPEYAAAEWQDRNVVAFDEDGELRWRIDAPDGDPSGTVESIWTLGDRVLVQTSDRRTHELALDTGGLRRTYAPTELPVGDDVLEFPVPVGFATERDGVVVVFLDVYGSDADLNGPVPGNRCVFGYDTDGTERWRVEPLDEEDVFTDVYEDGDSIGAHSMGGRNMHLDWETGETRPSSRRLW